MSTKKILGFDTDYSVHFDYEGVPSLIFYARKESKSYKFWFYRESIQDMANLENMLSEQAKTIPWEDVFHGNLAILRMSHPTTPQMFFANGLEQYEFNQPELWFDTTKSEMMFGGTIIEGMVEDSINLLSIEVGHTDDS